MTDTVFRGKIDNTESVAPSKPNGPTPSVTSVEVPYTSYETEHAKPYTVDHFELGDLWNDATAGFSKEVGLIENYLKSQITSGKLENSVKAVKEELKKIEKMTNTHKDSRKIIRLGTMSAYVKFLMETDDIRKNITRYGNTE